MEGSQSDPKYEFQAPQFIDFNKLEAEDDAKADEFFNVDMESGESWSSKMDLDEKQFEKNKSEEVKPAPRRPANMVTSWGAGVIKSLSGAKGVSSKISTTTISDEKKMSSKETETSTGSRGRPETPRRADLRAAVAASVENARNSPRRQTPKRLGVNNMGPRLGSGNRARTNSNNPGTGSVTRSMASTTAAAGLPKTPEAMRRYKNKIALAQGKSSTLSSISVPAMKQNMTSSKPALPPRPTDNKPTLTKPAEFKFATGSRAKPVAKGVQSSDVPDFNKMLRSYGCGGVVKGATQPQPFKGVETRKRRHSADTKYKSQAELIQNFHKATPDRFRSKPHQGNRTRHRSASPAPSPRVTLPQTPQLATRGRSRPTTVLSAEEREAQEVERNKQNQFKAHGVGETVPKFKYGEVERKPCTKIEPFHLTESKTRLPTLTSSEEQPAPFTARPLPKKILDAPLGVPEKKVQEVIVPQSPAFALKSRLAERKFTVPQEPVEPEPVRKIRPAPHRGVPVTLPPPSKKSTMPEPFSFADRDEQAKKKKEEKIQQMLVEEKAMREFHATSIPKVVETGGRLPERQPVATTKVEPFKLQVEERVETRLAKWQEDVNRELEEQRKAAQFKAHEPKVLEVAPFVPKKSDKPLSEISNFQLHSDLRAEEREQFNLAQKEKMAVMEGARREQEERRKREEEEEILRLRKEAVHKAQPIRKYKPVEVKASDKPLTAPASPCLLAGKTGKNLTKN